MRHANGGGQAITQAIGRLRWSFSRQAKAQHHKQKIFVFISRE